MTTSGYAINPKTWMIKSKPFDVYDFVSLCWVFVGLDVLHDALSRRAATLVLELEPQTNGDAPTD